MLVTSQNGASITHASLFWGVGFWVWRVGQNLALTVLYVPYPLRDQRQSGGPTILKSVIWVRGANPSTL